MNGHLIIHCLTSEGVSEVSGASEVSGVSEQANGQVSCPGLKSVFLVVLAHSALQQIIFVGPFLVGFHCITILICGF